MAPYAKRRRALGASRVPRGTCNPVGIWGDHPPRLSTTWRPIVNQYREGKAKRTPARGDRKSTRLNSSHHGMSYAVFCLKKKNEEAVETRQSCGDNKHEDGTPRLLEV